MGRHSAFGDFAQPVALHGLGQNHRGLALGHHGAPVGVEHLDRIEPAAAEIPELVVAHVLHQLEQLGILAEELFPEKRPVVRAEGLILAVHAFMHALDEQAARIAGEKIIPARAPDHLDHVPSGAQERRFQLLNDVAVAAHRTVQALQIAVHHEDQVVQPLAGAQRDRSQRFRLVGFAVAQERPNLAAGRRNDAAILQIPHEASLIDRRDRTEPHRYRRELPEVRHQPGMRIRRQPGMIPQLMAEVFQMLVA